MAQGRPAVPTALKRKLFEEAGYRCAVPTCRGTSALQMEHIEEWAKVKAHKFENMIVLCANCHARVTSKEIHKNAIRAYKKNLSVLSGRYSQAEWRLLDFVLDNLPQALGANGEVALRFPQSDQITYYGFYKDGFINFKQYSAGLFIGESVPDQIGICFTKRGIEFLEDYEKGKSLGE